MSTIQRYDVVDAPDVDQLVEGVQSRITQGWQPIGGPFTIGETLYQALVFAESSEDVEPTAGVDPEQADLKLIEELTEDDDAFPDWGDHLRQTSGEAFNR
jgi:hypothetical protein